MIKEIYNYIFSRSTAYLNRGQLGSIDLIDLKEDLTQDEIKDENSQIAVCFPLLERKIKKAIQEEIEFLARNADGDLQIAFGRGGINFADLLLREFEQMKNEHLDDTQPEENFNKFKIL